MSKKRKIIIIAVAAVLVLIAAVILILILSSPREKDGDIHFYYSNEDNLTYYTYGAEKGDTPIPGIVKSYLTTADKSKTVALTGTGELWYVSGNIALSIGKTNGVYAIAPVSGCVYFIGSDNLYKFDYSKQSSSVAASNFSAESLVVSPSGDYVLAMSEGKLKLHDGKFVRNLVGEGMTPLAISDDGELAYASCDDGCLYVYRNAEKARLTSEITGANFLFSRDSKSVVFSSRNRLYISENGEGKILISDGIASGSKILLVSGKRNSVSYGDLIVMTDAKEFKGELVRADDFLFCLQSGYESSPSISEIDFTGGFFADEKNVYYVKNEVLYRASVKNIMSPEAVVSSVEKFAKRADDSLIYYIDKSGKLFSEKDGKSTEIFSSADDVFVKSDGVAFFLSGSELYASSDGKSKIMLSRDVSAFSLGNHSAYYLKDNGGSFDLFGVNSGYKFKELYRGVSGRLD